MAAPRGLGDAAGTLSTDVRGARATGRSWDIVEHMFETSGEWLAVGGIAAGVDSVPHPHEDGSLQLDGLTGRKPSESRREHKVPRDPRFEQVLRAWWCDERPEWTGADWWDAPMRDEVRLLLLLPAGPVLAAELAELPAGGTCPHPHQGEAPSGWPSPGRAPGWPCACMVVLAAAWEACAAWVAAGCATALVQAAGPTEVEFAPPAPSPRISDPAREELAVALRTSPASMGNRMAAARDLCAHPALRGLVECAAISSWGARLVVLELAGLPDDLARTVVAEVVDRVRDRLASGRRPWTSAEIGRTARRVRLRRAPDHERAGRERAWADRTVQVFPDRNGMAVLHAVIDGTDAHRIHRRLSAIAQGLEDPERSRDQARADALVDLILGGVAGASAAGGADGMRADAPADAAGPRTADQHPSAAADWRDWGPTGDQRGRVPRHAAGPG